jgi:hypothetical protein
VSEGERVGGVLRKMLKGERMPREAIGIIREK